MLLHKDIPLSLKTLTLLKWQDSKGGWLKFQLANKVSAKWRDFGYRFGQEDELEEVEEECRGKPRRCWCKVMSKWMENGGTPAYPASWEGLITALEDVEYCEVAKELERALDLVILPPQPPSLPAFLPSPSPPPALPLHLLHHQVFTHHPLSLRSLQYPQFYKHKLLPQLICPPPTTPPTLPAASPPTPTSLIPLANTPPQYLH